MSGLSDVFKYISHFRHAGHQVGRKVGDMLEVLTYAAIVRDSELSSRLHVEPKLYGFSEAGHKVEFTLLHNQSLDESGQPLVTNGGEITDPSTIFAFIECKKVGVEQTVNSSFKRTFEKHNNKSYKVPFNTIFSITFAPRGNDCRYTYEVYFDEFSCIRISQKENDDFTFSEEVNAGSRIIFTLSSDNQSEVLGDNQSLRDVEYSLKICRILEIISIEDEYVVALLNDCLSGPQTPEKAKQSSFVALDVRKKRFNSFDKRPNEQEMISVLVLTEFAHWEQKSQNIITSCIDKNFIVGDEIIIEAFEAFEEEFGQDFYNMITKENFENNAQVRALAMRIVNSYDGKIFLDFDGEIMRKFSFSNGQLAFEE